MGAASKTVPGPNLSAQVLNTYVGKEITAICPHGFHDKTMNHCAHFVSHVMSLAVGVTCKSLSNKAVATIPGGCVKVHELFAKCAKVGLFADAPDEPVLVFVLGQNLVKLPTKSMTNVPKKHVGIHLDGTIWHYSNGKDKVVTASPDEFKKHYSGQVNEMYFGTFPAIAAPVASK